MGVCVYIYNITCVPEMNDVAPFYYVLIKIIIKSLFIYFYYYYFRRTTMMENRKAIFTSVYTIITGAGCAVCVFTLYMPWQSCWRGEGEDKDGSRS